MAVSVLIRASKSVLFNLNILLRYRTATIRHDVPSQPYLHFIILMLSVSSTAGQSCNRTRTEFGKILLKVSKSLKYAVLIL
jgi:hypothetical protein